MNEFKKIKINVSLAKIVLFILITASISLLIWYSFGGLHEKWAPLLGGAVVASFTALFQYWISYLDYENNERLSISGVKNFLKSRDDVEYYAALISNAKLEINCLFYVCKRFCEDFCIDGGRDNLLIQSLEKNPELKVRILIQDQQSLPEEEKVNYSIAGNILSKMIKMFPNQFEVKYYSHIPCHNLFITDKDAVIGPYFNRGSRKYDHSIHFQSTAEYVTDFKTYFEEEWKDGKD